MPKCYVKDCIWKGAFSNLFQHVVTHHLDNILEYFPLMEDYFRTEYERVLECEICVELMKAPIRQCVEGHSLCSDCFDKLTSNACPTCKSPFYSTRNYALERLSENIACPCTSRHGDCGDRVRKLPAATHRTSTSMFGTGRSLCCFPSVGPLETPSATVHSASASHSAFRKVIETSQSSRFGWNPKRTCFGPPSAVETDHSLLLNKSLFIPTPSTNSCDSEDTTSPAVGSSQGSIFDGFGANRFGYSGPIFGRAFYEGNSSVERDIRPGSAATYDHDQSFGEVGPSTSEFNQHNDFDRPNEAFIFDRHATSSIPQYSSYSSSSQTNADPSTQEIAPSAQNTLDYPE